MSINNNPNGFLNMPAFDAIRRMQEQFNNSAFAVTMRELQRTIDAVKVPTLGITTAIQAYQDSIARLTTAVQNINNLYAPILEQTRMFENVYNKSMVAALQSCIPAMKVMAGIDLSTIQSIVDAFPQYEFLSESILKNIDFSGVAEMYDEGTITDEDIAEEFSEIIAKKDFSIAESWDNVKKSKWFLAIRWLLIILMFLGSPVIDKVKDSTLDALGVNDFWEESGIYEWLDEVFDVEKDGSVVSEKEAKASVDESKTGNISKQKREDLIAKIKELRTFISSAPQDENTANLLSYLSDLEKDVNGKKYGLVFEEHREEIDEVLDTHTPVLTEDKDLFVDNGGQMNFLIEGDNLSSLKLLEKTHKGKIDLIYIDPPYNTQNADFMYNDTFVAADDLYRHSKWLSFMKKRLQLSRKLLANKGFIIISIDDNEASHLKALCDEIFDEDNYEKTDYIQVRYPDKTLKSDMHYHKEIEQVLVYRKSPEAKPYLKPQEYDYDKFIYSIKELSAGKEINLGGKKVLVFKQNEYEITRHDVGFKNGLKEIWATGTILNGNSSGRFFRDYLDGRKDIDGLGVLYKVYGIGDDQYPYRYFTGPKKATATKGKYYQGVPSEKMTEGATKITPIPNFYDMAGDFGNIRHEGGVPFNSGKKPVKLINMYLDYFVEKNITVLDFFAGSGSTGHAVLQRNSLDNGTRKFILCTNNESNICRNITYTRIKNVLSKNCGSLKYYKVDYIPISDRMYYEYADELLLHIRELVELENGINFIGNEEIGIVLTEEELDNFISQLENNTKCRKLYLGHDVLMDAQQAQVLRDRKITINIIPDYYYKELEG